MARPPKITDLHHVAFTCKGDDTKDEEWVRDFLQNSRSLKSFSVILGSAHIGGHERTTRLASDVFLVPVDYGLTSMVHWPMDYGDTQIMRGSHYQNVDEHTNSQDKLTSYLNIGRGITEQFRGILESSPFLASRSANFGVCLLGVLVDSHHCINNPPQEEICLLPANPIYSDVAFRAMREIEKKPARGGSMIIPELDCGAKERNGVLVAWDDEMYEGVSEMLENKWSCERDRPLPDEEVEVSRGRLSGSHESAPETPQTSEPATGDQRWRSEPAAGHQGWGSNPAITFDNALW